MSTALNLKNSTAFDMFDVAHDFKDNVDGLLIKKHQELPDAYLKNLRDEKIASSGVREKEYMKVASIPVAVVETWLAHGYDIHKMTAKQILNKLRSEDLDVFITTTKSI